MFWGIVVILIGGGLSLSCGELLAYSLTCSFYRTFCAWSPNISLIAITSRSDFQESATSYPQPEGSHFAFARSHQRKTDESTMETVLSSRSLNQSQETQISFRYIVHGSVNTSVGFMRLVTVTSEGQTNLLWSLNASQFGSPNTWLPARARLCESSEFHLEFQLSFEGSRPASDEIIGIGLANVMIDFGYEVWEQQEYSVLECSNGWSISSSVTCGPTAMYSIPLFCGWSIRDNLNVAQPRMVPYHSHEGGGEMSGYAYLSVKGPKLASGSSRTGVMIVSPSVTVTSSQKEDVFSFWYKCVSCSRARVNVSVWSDTMKTNTTVITLEGWAGELQQTWTPLALGLNRTILSFARDKLTFTFDVDFNGSFAMEFMLDRVWFSGEFRSGNVTGIVKDWNARTSPGFKVTATSRLIGAISTSVNCFSSPYSVPLASNEEYMLVFSAQQYHDVVVYTDTLPLSLYKGSFVVEAFAFIPKNQTGEVTVHGLMINAANGSFTWTINITLNFRHGINAKTEPIFQTAVMVSGSDGISVDLPTGYYTVEIAAEGFVTTFVTVIAVNRVSRTEFTGVLSPVLSENMTRVILTWTEWKTARLGAHVTMEVDGNTIGVSASNRCEPGSRIGAYMNINSQTVPGVEVITVEMNWKEFYYWVRENTTAADGEVYVLAHSGAKVEVISANAVIDTYNVPVDGGNLWHGFGEENIIVYEQWDISPTANPLDVSTTEAGSNRSHDSESGDLSSVSTTTDVVGSDGHPDSTPRNSVDRTTTDVIVGTSVSAAILIVVVGGIVWLCYRRKKQQRLGMRKIRRAADQLGTPLSDRNCSSNFYPLEKQSLAGEGPLHALMTQYTMLLKVLRSSLEIGFDQVLGRGQFGIVYKGLAHQLPTITRGPTIVAVKTLFKSADSDEQTQFAEEYKVMVKAGRHINIISILGIVLEEQPMLIIQYCRYGSLLSYLRSRRTNKMYSHVDESGCLLPLDEANMGYQWRAVCEKEERVPESEDMAEHMLSTNDLIKFGHQVSSGMEYLVSRSIIHRDLAARNVLVTDGKVLKISDFGLARVGGDYYTVSNMLIALPILWMPPDAILTRTFSEKSDVWSFGVLLWEVFSLGQTPYDGPNVTKLSANGFAEWLMEGHQMPRPDCAPLPIFDIMLSCWKLDKEDRPTFADIWRMLDAFVSKMDGGNSYLPLEERNEKFKELDEQIRSCILNESDVMERG